MEITTFPIRNTRPPLRHKGITDSVKYGIICSAPMK